MPFVPLSDDDCARAALAARAQAFLHEDEARNSDGTSELHLDQARRWRALAVHFEEARKASPEG